MYNKNINSSEFETGIVTAIHGNEVTVELNPNEACESCGARIVCSPNSNGKRIIKAENTLNTKIGQKVLLDTNSSLILQLSFIQYFIPLLGFIIGLFLFYFLNLSVKGLANEVVLFFGGLIGLFFGAMVGRFFVTKFAAKGIRYFSILKA